MKQISESKRRWRKLTAVSLFITALVVGLGVVAPAPPAHADVSVTIPATGDIILPGCVGTTSSPSGVINTPGDITLTGGAAEDLRSGKAVFLYDAKGQVIPTSSGGYNSTGSRLAYCGAILAVGSTDDVIIDWRFCTDEGLSGCAGQPPSHVEGNDKLSDDQEVAIAMQLVNGDKDTKRSRSLLQLQVWCISEYGETRDGVVVEPGNVNIQAQGYFNDHLFNGSSTSPETTPITAAEATCEPWGVLPEDPEVTVTADNSPVDLGESLEFTVGTNFTGEIDLTVTGNTPLSLCGPSQNIATLSGTVLSFVDVGSVQICTTPTVSGNVVLTAIGDDIPVVESLTFLWNSDPTCQVFADYALGPVRSATAQARATVQNLVPGYVHSKTADPVSGTEVLPGDVITYTITGENTGQTLLDPVILTDNLADVLDHASYNSDAAVVTSSGSTGVLNFDSVNQTITWDGSLIAGETVTITYSVTVDNDAFGNTLENRLSSSATPPGLPPITPPEVETEHPVPTPGFTLDKSSTPPEYSTVNPGDSINYTVTATNTGETVLDPVVVEDDLSQVLTNADLDTTSIAATINGAPTTAPTLNGTTMRWEGSLQPDDVLELTYSVTVHLDAAGVIIQNEATATGTPPGGEPIEPPEVDTEHPVPDPGFVIAKSSDPVDGSNVSPYDVIHYTITAHNTGDTILDPFVIDDDLAQVFAFATYTGDAVYTTSHGSTGLLTVDEVNATLNWTGSLEPGETVRVQYSVTVNEGTEGSLIHNVATGTGTPPGQPPIEPPPVEIEHPVPVPGFETSKTSNPVSGTEVIPGQTIEYLVTGVNTGETVLDPVVITDDLSGILELMTYNRDVSATINGAPAGEISVNTNTGVATWVGILDPGETVEIRYSFTVDEAASGQILKNVVTGSAVPPGHPPIEPPDHETVHPVPKPGFEIEKSADPVSGTSVNTGDKITYTLTGSNTGETVLDPVVLTDNLTGVTSEYASFNNDMIALVEGEESGTLVYDENTHMLTWTGVLEVGQAVTVSYSVTVLDTATGHTLDNVLSGSAVPPGMPPIEPPDQETNHPVPKPHLPTTGADSNTLLFAGIAFAALLIALGAVMVARRRSDIQHSNAS